jgi:hypothetical protein
MSKPAAITPASVLREVMGRRIRLARINRFPRDRLGARAIFLGKGRLALRLAALCHRIGGELGIAGGEAGP